MLKVRNLSVRIRRGKMEMQNLRPRLIIENNTGYVHHCRRGKSETKLMNAVQGLASFFLAGSDTQSIALHNFVYVFHYPLFAILIHMFIYLYLGWPWPSILTYKKKPKKNLMGRSVIRVHPSSPISKLFLRLPHPKVRIPVKIRGRKV